MRSALGGARTDFRFGISFYLVAMLFILFDIEVVFLYPVAVQLEAFGVFALVETLVFIALLMVAFVYVWRRGALDWKLVTTADAAQAAERSRDAAGSPEEFRARQLQGPRHAARRPRGRRPRAATSRSAS